jgi:hypothetical protein
MEHDEKGQHGDAPSGSSLEWSWENPHVIVWSITAASSGKTLLKIC